MGVLWFSHCLGTKRTWFTGPRWGPETPSLWGLRCELPAVEQQARPRGIPVVSASVPRGQHHPRRRTPVLGLTQATGLKSPRAASQGLTGDPKAWPTQLPGAGDTGVERRRQHGARRHSRGARGMSPFLLTRCPAGR